MGFFRVGIVDFFGILCPGVLLLGSLLLLLGGLGQLPLLPKEIADLLGSVVGSFAFVVVCYFLGFILRLISPDAVDVIAGACAPALRFDMLDRRLVSSDVDRSERDSTSDKLPAGFDWWTERYPYYDSTKYVYSHYYSPEFATQVIGESKHHNKARYNYWKTWLAANHADAAAPVYQAEAAVRLMSGAFWALLLGIPAGLILVVTAPLIGVLAVVICVLAIWIILRNFKNQRRREVKMLMDALHAYGVSVADLATTQTPSSATPDGDA